MFSAEQKQTALDFARYLAQRKYSDAYSLLAEKAKSQLSMDNLRLQFERMIPLDWGSVHPIELNENEVWEQRFIYVTLGGDTYSEGIIVNSFVSEEGSTRIVRFEFGRL